MKRKSQYPTYITIEITKQGNKKSHYTLIVIKYIFPFMTQIFKYSQ